MDNYCIRDIAELLNWLDENIEKLGYCKNDFEISIEYSKNIADNLYICRDIIANLPVNLIGWED